ncbi:MAG: hypothetical protein ABI400_06010 [Lacisediminihabitans sp.]
MTSPESAPLPVGIPAPAAAMQAQDPVLVRFGDAQLSQHWLVTPQGTMPLRGTQIFVADMSQETRMIPGWAIALAIIGAVFFLLGLFFLLVRETRRTGFMQITITNGAFTYQTAEPVVGDRAGQLFELQARANYARGIVARA